LSPKPDLRIWKLTIAMLLAWWFVYVIVLGHWALVREHLGIAAVMIGGSLVAGSTPMGGGSVAFPILVYGFGESPENARNFGLAIQALGMTSALIFILCRRTPIQKRLLLWSCVGAAVGIVAGAFLVAPYVARSLVKLLFACLWMSFAVLTLARNAEFCGFKGAPDVDAATAARIGLPVGLLGGVIASMIGVGLEMVLYTVLVLLFRCDLKVAVPTAVCATAITSLVGTALHIWIGDIPVAIFGNWLAAFPIVIFGAPAGVFLVTRIPRIRLLYFVSSLCVFQFAYTIWQARLSRLEWTFVASVLLIAFAGFVALYRQGRRPLMETATALVDSH
jgi:uncharacterized membrane protein YfcA